MQYPTTNQEARISSVVSMGSVILRFDALHKKVERELSQGLNVNRLLLSAAAS